MQVSISELYYKPLINAYTQLATNKNRAGGWDANVIRQIVTEGRSAAQVADRVRAEQYRDLRSNKTFLAGILGLLGTFILLFGGFMIFTNVDTNQTKSVVVAIFHFTYVALAAIVCFMLADQASKYMDRHMAIFLKPTARNAYTHPAYLFLRDTRMDVTTVEPAEIAAVSQNLFSPALQATQGEPFYLGSVLRKAGILDRSMSTLSDFMSRELDADTHMLAPKLTDAAIDEKVTADLVALFTQPFLYAGANVSYAPPTAANTTVQPSFKTTAVDCMAACLLDPECRTALYRPQAPPAAGVAAGTPTGGFCYFNATPCNLRLDSGTAGQSLLLKPAQAQVTVANACSNVGTVSASLSNYMAYFGTQTDACSNATALQLSSGVYRTPAQQIADLTTFKDALTERVRGLYDLYPTRESLDFAPARHALATQKGVAPEVLPAIDAILDGATLQAMEARAKAQDPKLKQQAYISFPRFREKFTQLTGRQLVDQVLEPLHYTYQIFLTTSDAHLQAIEAASNSGAHFQKDMTHMLYIIGVITACLVLLHFCALFGFKMMELDKAEPPVACPLPGAPDGSGGRITTEAEADVACGKLKVGEKRKVVTVEVSNRMFVLFVLLSVCMFFISLMYAGSSKTATVLSFNDTIARANRDALLNKSKAILDGLVANGVGNFALGCPALAAAAGVPVSELLYRIRKDCARGFLDTRQMTQLGATPEGQVFLRATYDNLIDLLNAHDGCHIFSRAIDRSLVFPTADLTLYLLAVAVCVGTIVLLTGVMKPGTSFENMRRLMQGRPLRAFSAGASPCSPLQEYMADSIIKFLLGILVFLVFAYIVHKVIQSSNKTASMLYSGTYYRMARCYDGV
jgi:flagellar biogenesis protein FliO